MIATLARSRIAADISALRASWGSARGGWRAAWQDAATLARHRQIVVTTPPGPEPVLLTRIRLSGETETCVLRAWLDGKNWEDMQPTVAAHFQAIAAAAAGWPAALGMARLGSRIAGIGGLVLAARQAIRDLLTGGPTALLHMTLTNWLLFAGLVCALVGFVARPMLRRWLRARIRRVPFGVPAQS